MAQKKIVLELSVVEAQHLDLAVHVAQREHERDLGRPNPALTRVTAKLDKATRARQGAEETEEVSEDADAGDHRADAD